MKNYLCGDIKQKIFKIIDPMSKALNIEIDIVDSLGIRIIGTGIYKQRTGNKINEIVYKKSILKNKTLVIENPGQNVECRDCTNGFQCMQKIVLVTPMICEGDIVGTIAFLSFSEHQRENILRSIESYTEVLENLSEMLINQFLKNNYEDIYKNLFFETDENIMVLDKDNNILDYNCGSKNLFVDIKDLKNKKVFIKPIGYKNYEVNISGIKKHLELEIRELGENVKILYIKKLIEVDESLMDDAILIGHSKIMTSLKEKMKKISKLTSPLIIIGGIGTNKEMFAKWLHKNSKQKTGKFISVNCRDEKNKNLLDKKSEIELLLGKIQLANKGTIFFDEIENMELHLQEQLLLFLEKNRKLDVRVIAATKINLLDLVEKNSFLEDLYYKLSVYRLEIPSMKYRKDDIEDILDYLFLKCSEKLLKKITLIEPRAKKQLCEYDWKGNWKEVESVVKYIVESVDETGIVTKDMIPEKIKNNFEISDFKYKQIRKISEIEREEILAALIQYGWDIESKKKISKKLGVGIATLYRKIEKYQIDKNEVQKLQ